MVVLLVVILRVLNLTGIVKHIFIHSAVTMIEVVDMVKNILLCIYGCQMVHVVGTNNICGAICCHIVLRRVGANLSLGMSLIDLLHKVVAPVRVFILWMIDILEIDAHDPLLLFSQWGGDSPHLSIRCGPFVSIGIYGTGTESLQGSCASLAAGITETPVMILCGCSEFIHEHLLIGQNLLFYDGPREFIIAMTTGECCAGDESQCSCYQILFHLNKILIECYVTKYQLMAQN